MVPATSSSWASAWSAATAPWDRDRIRTPSLACRRARRSSALPRYAMGIGRGLPFTRRDSTIYQYEWPLTRRRWRLAIALLYTHRRHALSMVKYEQSKTVTRALAVRPLLVLLYTAQVLQLIEMIQQSANLSARAVNSG